MKSHKIDKTTWYFRNKFLSVQVNKDQTIHGIYNKFDNKRVEDFCYETTDLKTLRKIMNIFEEDLNLPIVDDLPSHYDMPQD